MALAKAGPEGALAPLLLLFCIVLLRFPELCLGLLLFGTAMAESEPIGAIPSGERFYDLVAAKLTGPDILILFGLAGILLRFVAQDLRPRLPEPLTAPLVVLGLAALAGVATAYSSSAGVEVGDLFHRGVEIGHLIAVPLLVVNVLRDKRSLQVFAAFLAFLACVKGLTGLYASLGGAGAGVEEEVASFLSPFPNLLMLTFALGVIAALVRKVEIPTWMYVGMPVCLLALLLSYRRSFWIAAILTIVLVVIIASRRRGRAVLAIAAVALALGLGATASISDNSGSGTPSPIAQRAQTLTPGGLGSNRGDRYRMDERRNVIENIKEHPVTGIGLGIDWEVHRPLAEAHDRRYVHLAFLWYWLAFGILGAIAYVLLFASSLWTSVQVWRHHPDAVVQICAIAAFGGILGLAVVELTTSFAGIEPRLTILLGSMLGWLAAAWQDLPARRATAGD